MQLIISAKRPMSLLLFHLDVDVPRQQGVNINSSLKRNVTGLFTIHVPI